MEQINKVNGYTCDRCPARIVTVNRADGVTPFMVLHSHAPEHGLVPCSEQFIKSCFYRVPQDLEPTHEWYKPEKAPRDRYEREHWEQGGLSLRRIVRPERAQAEAPRGRERNDRCSCGSGLKRKRCSHAAGARA